MSKDDSTGRKEMIKEQGLEPHKWKKTLQWVKIEITIINYSFYEFFKCYFIVEAKIISPGDMMLTICQRDI